MTPLTIACVLVKGEYPYTPEYVRRLQIMCRRYVQRPYDFVCLTDQPKAMPTGAIPIHEPRLEGCFAEWTKMRLFDLFRKTTGRILFIDLDSLIVSDLDPVIDYPAPIALIQDYLAIERAHLNTDRYGRQLNRKFQGSVMVWDAGEQFAHVWDRWTLQDALRLSTSQDWMYEMVPDAAAMPEPWFPRASRVPPPWPDGKIVLAKKPKGFEAVQKWPWFNGYWGGWEA